MKTHLRLFTAIILFGASLLHAQDNFQLSYSANGDVVIEWLVQTGDGNLLLAGNTDAIDPYGDGILIKTDPDGNIIWSKTFGGDGEDNVEKIISCTDGGCVVTGYSNSYGQGDYDAWISRFNSEGEIIWSDYFGTYNWDGTKVVIQTKNGGFLWIGQDDHFTGTFMLSLNPEGELLWKKEYTAGGLCWFTGVFETDEGGFYLTGSINHDGFGSADGFIVEADATGDIIRGKYYGEYDNEALRFLAPFQDGFLAVGDTWSWEAGLVGWIMKVDADLNVEKSIVLGDFNTNQNLESVCFSSNSLFMALKLTSDNAYIVELDSLLTLKDSWQFNPRQSAYSSLAISLEDSTIIFSGSFTNDQTYRKDAYLTKFRPSDNTYDCNMIPHTTSILNVGVLSNNLYLYETDNDAVFQRIVLENNDISLEAFNLCIPVPMADFVSSDVSCMNAPVSFNNESEDGDSYKWYFEGGTPATSDSFDPGPIIYENPGYYSIKLVVNNEGGADSISKYISIYHGFDFSLGPDTTILLSSSLQFVAFGEYDSLRWSTGETTSYLVIQATDLELGNNQIWLDIYEWPCINSDTININVVDNSSINENIHPEILLYPNPAGKSGQIALKSPEVPGSVVFYNQMGTEVLKLHPSDNLLDVRCLEPGVYIVELTFHEYILKRRLIII
jgi:PKD repeat protein